MSADWLGRLKAGRLCSTQSSWSERLPQVVVEVAVLGGGVGSGGGGDPGVLEAFAGGVAFALFGEAARSVGVAGGDERSDQVPAIERAQGDAGDGEIAIEQVTEGGERGGRFGEGAEGAEPDDALVGGSGLPHAAGGERLEAGGPFGAVGQVAVEGEDGARESGLENGLVGFGGEEAEGEGEVAGGGHAGFPDGVPERAPEDAALEGVGDIAEVALDGVAAAIVEEEEAVGVIFVVGEDPVGAGLAEGGGEGGAGGVERGAEANRGLAGGVEADLGIEGPGAAFSEDIGLGEGEAGDAAVFAGPVHGDAGHATAADPGAGEGGELAAGGALEGGDEVGELGVGVGVLIEEEAEAVAEGVGAEEEGELAEEGGGPWSRRWRRRRIWRP